MPQGLDRPAAPTRPATAPAPRARRHTACRGPFSAAPPCMLRTNSISGRRVHAPRQPWQRPLHAPRQLRCRSRSCSYCTRRDSCCHGSGRCMPHSSCVVAAAAAAIAYCTHTGAAAPTAMAAAVATCCSYCTRHSNCCHGHGSGHWTCCMRSGSYCHSRGSGRCVARTMSCRQSHGRHGRVAVAAMAAAVTRTTAAAAAAMAAIDACAMAAALSQLQLQRFHAPQQLLLQPRQRPPHGLHAPRPLLSQSHQRPLHAP